MVVMQNNKLVIYATAMLLIVALLVPILAMGHVRLNEAEAALQVMDYATAADSFSRAAELLPWRGDLWEQAGLAASKQRDYPKAIMLLQRAPDLSEEGWLALGYSYYLSGDLQSAQVAFETGIDKYSSARAYGGLAQLFRARKEWRSELNALQDQLRLQEDVRARYRLGLLLTVLAPEEALPQLKLAASEDAQFDPAVNTLQAALKDASGVSNVSRRMVMVGRALGLVHEWELSMSAFEKARDLDAENAEAWAWLGEAQQQTGLDGREALDRAVSLDHTSATVRALRGLYWNRQGNYEQMLAEYLLAAGYDPNNPAWQASIGDAYIKLGDLVSALDSYQHATDLAPEDSTYWRLLALFCAENGVHVQDVGLPAAQKAVEIAPSDPLALDALGFLYFSTGRFANAEQTLKSVLELSPGYLPAHIHIAMNYLTQGDRAAAFSELTLVRDADEGGPNGRLAEQLLKQYFP